ncbi:hypothetical protein DMH27_24820 [Raoultella planticola]|nr:hypothetical protein [Raoultella planticola]
MLATAGQQIFHGVLGFARYMPMSVTVVWEKERFLARVLRNVPTWPDRPHAGAPAFAGRP